MDINFLVTFKITFLSVLFEAIPFILFGSFISSLINEFVTEEHINNFIPNNKFFAVIGASFAGLLFPVCECAIVPIMRRLLQKGMPIFVAIPFMVSVPIINPVVLFSTYMYKYSEFGGELWIPIYNQTIDIGIFFIPFSSFVILAMVNSVNLTDGLDGLAVTNVFLVAMFFGSITMALDIGSFEIMNLNYIVAGSCMGFFQLNKNPAKIFMGDTGSLSLGGILAMIAIVLQRELILLLVGIVFVMETVSVILQVISFKTRGKRIFKMSPIHHHFELSGLSEKKVVLLFIVITTLGMILSIPII